MNRSKHSRRDFLKTGGAAAAAGMAAPYFFTGATAKADEPGQRQAGCGGHRRGGTRLGHRPPGSEAGQHGRLRRRPPRPRPPVRRGNRKNGRQVPGLSGLPQGAGPQGRAGRDDRHARPLARQGRHRRDARRQGRLLREAADADHRREPAGVQGGQGHRPRVSGRHATAERVRPLLPGGGGHRPQRPAGVEAEGAGHHRQGAVRRTVSHRRAAQGAGLGLLAGPGARGGLLPQPLQSTLSAGGSITPAAR